MKNLKLLIKLNDLTRKPIIAAEKLEPELYKIQYTNYKLDILDGYCYKNKIGNSPEHAKKLLERAEARRIAAELKG